jgi:serine protease AprX
MAVGSLKYLASEKTFIVSNFSSRGPTLEGLAKPDVVMFGEDIVMASSASDTATIAKSGTSFSTPFVSGFGILYREGTYRLAVATQPIPGISIPVTWGVAVQDIIDKYLPLLCIKPEGVSLGKDNDYGYGLAFGPLVLRALGYTAAQAVDISALLLPVVAIGMMGILMSTMMKG